MDTPTIARCEAVLAALQKKAFAEPFLQPVDWKGLGIPDYPQVVKEPMDLSTVQAKLHGKKMVGGRRHNQYQHVDEFWADLELIWSNCVLYNQQASPVHQDAIKMRGLTRQMKQKFDRGDTFGVVGVAEVGSPGLGKKRKRKAGGGFEDGDEGDEGASAADRVIPSFKERAKLCRRICKLKPENLGTIVKFVREKQASAAQKMDQTRLVLDLDSLEMPVFQETNQ
uniref:Bromo domain-containing protein n=1 Tax=Chromera velia CCMP2878 TaxID=1169474 RepID=A0A0G4GR25_9ALVE|eukprot:Cvel_5085.t1-p1 / transcript=Cvel_5085.t1 / gene=Cvel_5085 / organism=Chromera_velia_CCMP2878 / gene_product=SWR1 complex bromodomain subunit bdf1, putative / transcript_product=SWR1 complex bromodomain subunit bdf1, putative / location=Cvel_scaffold231:106306-109360(+) / protein_length=224 / sequence_SO=supercontig / SO=protein_coding / is_pseudo=false